MHEIITTSLHSRKVLTVPTDWNDDISEIGTTTSNNNNNNKFSPLNVLRRKKHESPKNFQIVRPTEEPKFPFVEEERELTEFEPEYYWENSRDNNNNNQNNVERRDPPEDCPDDGTSTKPQSNPFYPDKNQVIRNHPVFFDAATESPAAAAAAAGIGVPAKPSIRGEDRQSRKPNKVLTRPGRDEPSTDATVQMSLVLQQKKKSTKKIIDMTTSSKKKKTTILTESTLATSNRQLSHQDNGLPTFQRHTHALETKRTQPVKTMDDCPSECDDSKAKPTVSAAIVRRSTGRPVSKWFKPRKTIIPVPTGTPAESNNDSSPLAKPEDGIQHKQTSAADVHENMEPESQIQKNDDPFNQLCQNIWSSGTELLSTTSAVLDSIGMEAKRSIQHIVSATVVNDPTKAIMPSQQEPSPAEKAQDLPDSGACDKLEHPCIVRNFQKERKGMNTSIQTGNHAFHLTYIPPQPTGQQALPSHSEKQHKHKAYRKKNTLPAAAKSVGHNSPRWTKPIDGKKYHI